MAHASSSVCINVHSRRTRRMRSSAASRAAAHDELSAHHHDLLIWLWQVRHRRLSARRTAGPRAELAGCALWHHRRVRRSLAGAPGVCGGDTRAATSRRRRPRVTGGWRGWAQEATWSGRCSRTRPAGPGLGLHQPGRRLRAWAAGHPETATSRWRPRRSPLRAHAGVHPLRACRASSA